MNATKPASNWWYLLPILLGIIGAIIAWFRLRKTDPRKARNMIIVGFSLTLVDWIVVDYYVNPWFGELEQVNLWCAEEFDKAISDEIDASVYHMIENECFTHFDDWKHDSISLNDGTAESVLNEKGMTISEMVQHNIKRELGLD